jgi:hypothetical protein
LDIYDAVHRVGTKFKKDPRIYGEFVQGGSPALFSITYELPDAFLVCHVLKGDPNNQGIRPSIPSAEGSWASSTTGARCTSSKS